MKIKDACGKRDIINIGTYKFRNVKLRKAGLTGDARLRFMGCAVMNNIVTSYLIDILPDSSPEDLSLRRTYIVSGEPCFWKARKILSNANVVLPLAPSLVIDIFHSVVGAIYQDCGRNVNICKEWLCFMLDAIDSTCCSSDLSLCVPYESSFSMRLYHHRRGLGHVFLKGQDISSMK